VVDWPVLFIGTDIELPMALEVENAATVGPDRVVAAAAAFEAVGGPLVVASFGTALTISAVSAEGVFLGGVICPGLRLGAKVLHEATAALPLVELPRPSDPKSESDRLAATRRGARPDAPQADTPPETASESRPSPFAKNTVAAIQAGLFYQAGGTLREVVERMATEFSTWPHLVLTGGDAELVAPSYEFVDSVVPNLTLMGINLAYRKHVESMGGKR
jgi:type III pantothenate kinase